MHRIQIQLTEAQIQALRDVAAQQHRSIADIARECVDLYLHTTASADRGAIVERARKAAGRYASGRADTSTRHDDYLSEAFR